MAKSAKIVPFRPSYAKPVVIRTTVVKKAKHKKHTKHGAGMGKGLFNPMRMGIVMGGAALGFIQKQGIKIPALPLIGEAGTIGLIAYAVSGNGSNKLAAEICTAALTVAAYELTSTGSVVGEDDNGTAFPGYVAGV